MKKQYWSIHSNWRQGDGMTANMPKPKHIPQFEIENIARIILPKMQAYFES